MNVINEYNRKYANQAIKNLLKARKVLSRDGDKLYYNANNKVFFGDIVAGNIHVTKEKEDFGGIARPGVIITPFDIFCMLKHNGAVLQAAAEITKLLSPQNIPFVRVGSDYFLVKKYTGSDGRVKSDKLIPFLKGEIKEDYGNDVIQFLEKYDEFCIEPDNINYRGVFSGNYNNYRQVYHTAKEFDIENDMEKIHWSMTMMKHIFGEQLEMGLDYMKLIWEKPKQILPILVLASELRQTGKTTFANWQEMIYGENLVSIGVGDMKGEFNAHIAEKLIIVIEETVSESHALVNRIKMISTAKKMLVNKKMIAQYSVDFYGKILILTNKPDKFLQIDNEEIRFWVRDVPVIEEGNHSIEADLEREIPYFLYYLMQREEVNTSRSRMVFTPEELGTDALKVVKNESKSALQKDIETYIEELMLSFQGVKEFQFTAIDIKKKFFDRDNSISVSRVSRTLKEMKLKQNGKNGKYYSITKESLTGAKLGNGNFFTMPNPHYLPTLDNGALPF